MEKRLGKPEHIKKIAIIGPECTGKTTISKQLANYFKTQWIPEFAREYIQNLNRAYNYEDVEFIGRKQLEQLNATYDLTNKFIFFDTDLIITKVWFQVVYNKIPSWIDDAIITSKIDLYLLCNTDLPWMPDKVRENGGEMREKLFLMYKNEIEAIKIPYFIVKGEEKLRTENTINFIENYFI